MFACCSVPLPEPEPLGFDPLPDAVLGDSPPPEPCVWPGDGFEPGDEPWPGCEPCAVCEFCPA